jgi:protease I
MDNSIKGIKVAILATDGFEQSELADPRKALDEAGATTTIVSLKDGTIRGWKNKDWGIEVRVDQTVDNAKADDFDALVLPGGVMNPDKLRTQAKAVEFVKAFFKVGKPVAAICHGPWMVIEAGGAKGRRMTSWPSVKTDITNAGGTWVDEEAVEDGNLITSRKPDDIPAFNRALIKLLSSQKKNTKAAA